MRRFASFSFILRSCLSLGITVYTPCVALNTIAGIPYWVSLITMTALTIVLSIMVCLVLFVVLLHWIGLHIVFLSSCFFSDALLTFRADLRQQLQQMQSKDWRWWAFVYVYLFKALMKQETLKMSTKSIEIMVSYYCVFCLCLLFNSIQNKITQQLE